MKRTLNLKKYIPGVLVIAGAGILFAGILREEHAVVLKKAITICLECIGIG